MAKRSVSTWRKLHKLGQSDDELDVAYAEIIATAANYRIENGIKQSDLVKKSGLSLTAISNLESQRSVPSLKTFLKYLRSLDLDWAFIMNKK